jgi:hypothetical protein
MLTISFANFNNGEYLNIFAMMEEEPFAAAMVETIAAGPPWMEALVSPPHAFPIAFGR